MPRATARRQRTSSPARDGKPRARPAKGAPDARGFRLDDYVFYLMAHVQHQYHEGMAEEFRKHGLTRPQWRCLIGLHERGPMSMGELAALTLLQQSTVSRVVARMETEGLVARRPRDDDARVIEARITPRGEEKLQQILRVVGIQYERAMRDIDEEEVERLRSTLNAMHANLTRSPFA